MRRTIEIVSVQGNSASGRKTIIAPVGLDYITCMLVGATAVASNVTVLQEKINQELIRDITGTDQDGMNQVDKLSAMSVDNILSMPFEMVGMKSIQAQYGTTRNTLSPDPETGNAINSYQYSWVDSTTDTWRVLVEVDDATTGGPGGITRFQKSAISVASSTTYGASIQSYLSVASPEKRFFRRGFFLFTTTTTTFANGDTVIFRGAAKNEIYRRTYPVNTRRLTDANLRSRTGTYSVDYSMVIDTTESGISEMFDTMRVATDAEVKAAVKPSGFAVMGGQSVMPETMFDPRFSPSASDTLTFLVETTGRL